MIVLPPDSAGFTTIAVNLPDDEYETLVDGIRAATGDDTDYTDLTEHIINAIIDREDALDGVLHPTVVDFTARRGDATTVLTVTTDTTGDSVHIHGDIDTSDPDQLVRLAEHLLVLADDLNRAEASA